MANVKAVGHSAGQVAIPRTFALYMLGVASLNGGLHC